MPAQRMTTILLWVTPFFRISNFMESRIRSITMILWLVLEIVPHFFFLAKRTFQFTWYNFLDRCIICIRKTNSGHQNFSVQWMPGFWQSVINFKPFMVWKKNPSKSISMEICVARARVFISQGQPTIYTWISHKHSHKLLHRNTIHLCSLLTSSLTFVLALPHVLYLAWNQVLRATNNFLGHNLFFPLFYLV